MHNLRNHFYTFSFCKDQFTLNNILHTINLLQLVSKVPGSNPLGAQLGLRTQPRCDAPHNLWVEIVENVVIHIRVVRLSHQE